MKTQLFDYGTSIPLSNLEYRSSGNLEKTLSPVRWDSDSGGSATVNLQMNFWDPWHSWSRKKWRNGAEEQRGRVWLLGCQNVTSLLQTLEAEGFFFHSNSKFWKSEPCAPLPRVESLSIPGRFSAHLWQFVMDFCQRSSALYTRSCRDPCGSPCPSATGAAVPVVALTWGGVLLQLSIVLPTLLVMWSHQRSPSLCSIKTHIDFMRTSGNWQQIAASQKKEQETSAYGVHAGPGIKLLSHDGTLLKPLVSQRKQQWLKPFSESICPLTFAFDRLQFIQYFFSLIHFSPSSSGISSSWFHCSTLRQVQGYKLMPRGCYSPRLRAAFFSCFVWSLTGHSFPG